MIITKAPDDIIYAGDNVTLICHIEADSINVANLSVSIILEGPDGVIANDTHDLDDDLSVTILNYSATLMSVKPSNDSEIYTCKAVYTLKDDIPHVTFEESSNLVVINVIGKHKKYYTETCLYPNMIQFQIHASLNHVI